MNSLSSGLLVNRYCLRIARLRWPLCFISPQTMMKTCTDVFLMSTKLPIHKSYHRNAYPISKCPPPHSRLTIKLTQWPLSGTKYSCECLWITVDSILILPCKLPYNKVIHCLFGVACLILLVSGWLLSSVVTSCSLHPLMWGYIKNICNSIIKRQPIQ